MRTTQWIAASLLTLAACISNAAPVLITSPFINWYSDEFIQLDDLYTQIGDCRMGCTGFEYRADLAFPRDGVTLATSNRHGTVDYTSSYAAGETNYDFHLFEEVSARVDASVRGLALAAMSLDRFAASFDVFEPTLYTGTFDIYAGSVVFSPSHVSEWITSGTVLNAGRYSTTVVRSGQPFLTTGQVHEGQSVYASRDTNWSYNFSRVPVPAPAPIALVLLGLASIVLSRYRTR